MDHNIMDPMGFGESTRNCIKLTDAALSILRHGFPVCVAVLFWNWWRFFANLNGIRMRFPKGLDVYDAGLWDLQTTCFEIPWFVGMIEFDYNLIII